ncbi:uncharacterized protein LOC114940773 [Nylanderia fulva]|uniref:uncharacterized protein LOC114940773 n=1 Tax=Nylanderia fulva TaxID=613905 RepID=UPI0010FB3D40|nr:uncharacterized protein LOC114940773 [Nylanderia fulva]
MYRQILIHLEDRNLQQILWRYSCQDEVSDYRLNTVTYGLACAPFLAMRTFCQLADDKAESFPLGSRVLRGKVYMDDILTGASTLEEACELQRQLTGLCMAGGFPLRKWSANDPGILKSVPAEHLMQRALRDWRSHETHGTMGLRWHPATDEFSFFVPATTLKDVIKRSVLFFTARLFDPLGWLASVIVRAKIFFQSTWLRGLGWDEQLEEAAERQWHVYAQKLPLLESLRVPRWLEVGPPDDYVELHGFADASERAYAAVLYIRTGDNGFWHARLVAAKTKVAPVKPVTLPRLELCAAALLARLTLHACSTLGLFRTIIHLWSDSITLGWIRGHPNRWKTFVANRVSEIQTMVPDARWHHVSSQDNPADCASRRLSPEKLLTHLLWWRGPSWFQAEPSSWPGEDPASVYDDWPEKRTAINATRTVPVPVEEPDELRRCSSLNRLLRLTAWCR